MLLQLLKLNFYLCQFEYKINVLYFISCVTILVLLYSHHIIYGCYLIQWNGLKRKYILPEGWGKKQAGWGLGVSILIGL
jgi:hypothetical protein